jgi:catechol-2,3-dioxygenase
MTQMTLKQKQLVQNTWEKVLPIADSAATLYMRIEHVALWTTDLERSKEFYTKFFGATSCPKYVNPNQKTGDVFPKL